MPHASLGRGADREPQANCSPGRTSFGFIQDRRALRIAPAGLFHYFFVGIDKALKIADIDILFSAARELNNGDVAGPDTLSKRPYG